ncbi:hypothetical protein ABZ960_02045 [Streptomyces pseudovenezuelae]|uniref:effector-associated constant component EACC1 n=1 Tax=Streptomyces pseudovenezuelae TaxID=67350 RepID=UPI0034A0DAFE
MTTDPLTEQVGLTLTLDGAGTADGLRGLHAALDENEQLSPLIEVLSHPPAEGRMGPELWGLHLPVHAEEALALVYAVTAWVRYTTGDVTVRIKRDKDGAEVSLDGKRLRKKAVHELRASVERITEQLTAQTPAPTEESGDGPAQVPGPSTTREG